MPLHRQKSSPKKINNSGISSLKYGRIPSLFVSLISIFIVAGATVWLINGNGVIQKPNPQVAAVRERIDGSIDVDPNNAKVEQVIQTNLNEANTTTKPETAEPDTNFPDSKPTEEPEKTAAEVVKEEVKPVKPEPSTKTDENIVIKELDNCSVTYKTTAPDSVKTVTASKSFWVPNTKCNNNELELIQIVSSKTKPFFHDVEIQNLDQDSEYAIIYWANKKTSSKVDFSNYLSPLTKFLGTGKLYFTTKDAFDKLTLSNKDSYYLSGNCNGESSGACVLWGLPANGNLVSLLTDKGVANTATGQANNLKQGQYLKFAKTQDKNNRLVLVLKKAADKIDVIYLDSTKNYSIDEVKSFDKNTPNYDKYLR